MTEATANLPGPILLAGGREFDGRMASADRTWLRHLGLAMPTIAVIPTASADRPKQAGASGTRHFKGLLTRAMAVMIEDTIGGNDAANVATLEASDAFYFTGGDPNRLVKALEGSLGWETIVRRRRKGAAIGGSSAGAMALCDDVLAWERWDRGLGLIPGLAVLPHFDRREEAAVASARKAIQERGLVGLGLDESTAAIWHAGEWRVGGRGRVVVIGGEGPCEFRDGELITGVPQPR